LSNNCGYEIPEALAAFGSKETGVKPGIVLTSKKTTKDRDEGKNIDISNRDTLNSRLNNPTYYTA